LPADKEPVGKMLGEVLRDMGLLVLVFMPLETALSKAPVPVGTFWQGIGYGLGLVILGIVLERKRP
jgi:hypothetical protein